MRVLRWTWPALLFLLILGLSWGRYAALPSRILDIAVVDKTVPYANRVEHRIKVMGLTDTESAKVLRRFAEARRERRAWTLGWAALLVAIFWFGWKALIRLRGHLRRGALRR